MSVSLDVQIVNTVKQQCDYITGLAVPNLDYLQQIPDDLLSQSKYLYFGSSFCQELLPTSEELKRATQIAKNKNLSLVLVTPPITETFLMRFERLLAFLKK